ncbi:MAG: hypothetical protein II135_01430 [Clostridia bacterium]|nr:hypothetical protein [Clostridia bacterium]
MKDVSNRIFACIVLLSALFALTPSAKSADTAPKELCETVITHDGGNYGRLTTDKKTYEYDFSETDVKFYSSDPAISTSNLRTNMIFDGKTLSCREGQTFSFGSATFLGDDYGVCGGEASFKIDMNGGKLGVGLRLSKKAADEDHRGIWFVFDNGGLYVSEPESGLKTEIKNAPQMRSGTVRVADKRTVIELYFNDKAVCFVEYDGYTGALAVKDASGKKLGGKDESDVRAAGYFTLYADGLSGGIDDLSFDHTDVTLKPSNTPGFGIDYTTWIATDDRGRTTVAGTETRENKQVGMFYFLSHTGEDTEELHDVTRIYTEDGLDGLNDQLTDPKSSGCYYWAEPYYGYYRSTDVWVFRKHAYQLEAAGVDYIFLDFTNGAYYPEALHTLLDTWLQMRKEGVHTPDICIFCAGRAEAVVGPLRGWMYSEQGFEEYGELFYKYKGKPLLLAGIEDDDNSDLANWIRDTFTVRNCWAWQDGDGCWNWLQEYKKTPSGKYKFVNGGKGRDENGVFEQLALCVGHHPTTSKGRSFENGNYPKINGNDYGFSLDSGAGIGYASQFDAVMFYDPDMITITGWNEWSAGLMHMNEYDTYAGSETLGFQFVDQFNTEYSRDAEPMRMRQGDGPGFGDNFYYQTVDFIRRFKGTGAVTKASGQVTVDMTDSSAWNNVGPVYGDSVGDTAWRSEEGYFSNCNYVNNTGRNDLVSAKVSQDSQYLYFVIKTADKLVTDDGANWMNLFVDTDNDPETGWEGYDLVLNRGRDGFYVTVESLKDGWSGKQIGQALYTVNENEMIVRLDKSVAGIDGKAGTFSFKWADNSTLNGDVMEFSELGDTAPDDRFAYLYICEEPADQTPEVRYSLLGANGEAVAPHDERVPLVNNGGQEKPGRQDEAPASSKKTVYKHSAALKATIIATGAVIGACAFTVIVVSDKVKRRKKE